MEIKLEQTNTDGTEEFSLENIFKNKMNNLNMSIGILRSQQKLLDAQQNILISGISNIIHNICVIAPHKSHLFVIPVLELAKEVKSKIANDGNGKEACTRLNRIIKMLILFKENDMKNESEEKSVFDHSIFMNNIQAAIINTGAILPPAFHERMNELVGQTRALNRELIEETQLLIERYAKLAK